jgi:hypothetical protein
VLSCCIGQCSGSAFVFSEARLLGDGGSFGVVFGARLPSADFRLFLSFCYFFLFCSDSDSWLSRFDAWASKAVDRGRD